MAITLIQPISPGTQMVFKLTGERGAILITNDWTHQEDIRRKDDFEKYTTKYYSSWVAFARESGHGDVKPVLVAGVDRTKQFATMVYSENRAGTECVFQVETPTPDSTSPPRWGSWSTQGIAHTHTNVGPSLPVSRETQDPDECNQCVFIRYYTIRKRLGIPRLIKAGAGPHRLPEGGTGGGGAASVVRSGEKEAADLALKDVYISVSSQISST